MKTLRGWLAVFAIIFAADDAHGSMIIGSEALSGNRTIANTTNINTATSMSFLSFTVSNTSGNFDNDPTTNIVGTSRFVLSLLSSAPSPSVFTISTPEWGTFQATSFYYDVNDAIRHSRNLFFRGTFTPGTNFAPFGYTQNTVSFQLSLTQSGGSGKSISASASMVTEVPTPPDNIVPEAATLGLAIFGVMSIGFARVAKLGFGKSCASGV